MIVAAILFIVPGGASRGRYAGHQPRAKSIKLPNDRGFADAGWTGNRDEPAMGSVGHGLSLACHWQTTQCDTPSGVLFHVLNHLAQPLDGCLNLDHMPGDFDVGALRADRVRFAKNFLRQKF